MTTEGIALVESTVIPLVSARVKMLAVFAHSNKKWETSANGTRTAHLPPLHMNGHSNWICNA